MDEDTFWAEYEKERRERLAKILETPVERRREFRAKRRKVLWDTQYSHLICGCFGGKTSPELMEEQLDEEFGADSR